MDVVVPEQVVASVTHVVQDSETGPGSKEFWKLYRVVVIKLILVISSLAAQAGKVVAVCCVQAEASHSPGHQTSGRNNCIENKIENLLGPLPILQCSSCGANVMQFSTAVL